jgi:hypothetical protein
MEQQFIEDICILIQVYEKHSTACKRLQQKLLNISASQAIVDDLVIVLNNDDINLLLTQL